MQEKQQLFFLNPTTHILLSADIYLNPKGCISYGRQMYILQSADVYPASSYSGKGEKYD